MKSKARVLLGGFPDEKTFQKTRDLEDNQAHLLGAESAGLRTATGRGRTTRMACDSESAWYQSFFRVNGDMSHLDSKIVHPSVEEV